MPKLYEGILCGNHIEWVGEAPPSAATDSKVRVLVALLPEPDDAERGRRMAEALERLAARGGVAGIPDPLAWEREMRKDRPLPGRDD